MSESCHVCQQNIDFIEFNGWSGSSGEFDICSDASFTGSAPDPFWVTRPPQLADEPLIVSLRRSPAGLCILTCKQGALPSTSALSSPCQAGTMFTVFYTWKNRAGHPTAAGNPALRLGANLCSAISALPLSLRTKPLTGGHSGGVQLVLAFQNDTQ